MGSPKQMKTEGRRGRGEYKVEEQKPNADLRRERGSARILIFLFLSHVRGIHVHPCKSVASFFFAFAC
jgi:hypothetical protein